MVQTKMGGRVLPTVRRKEERSVTASPVTSVKGGPRD